MVMTVFYDGPENLHPYECDGPGYCVHCDRAYEKSITSETGTALRDHDPATCPLCDPAYDNMPNPHWKGTSA